MNDPKITRLLTIFVEHGVNGSYTMMAKPMKTLQLHYPMIQFFNNIDEKYDIIMYKISMQSEIYLLTLYLSC